ncbi:MAG TPA: RNA polymerase sigma factor [Candidatus Avoscillospira avistercoris]|uniref:RNA polymerase sigma factor n=1 Tax=Candidatus Avoscillospira avistercoris TaxID=2840707 RepID=A0A9D1F989_9FIRM|nr:RNA polymerase sigma factor [Candidatus Avoscillospira avistercoris]
MEEKRLDILVERSQSGDRAAQEELIAFVQSFVYHHCCKLLDDRESALDVTQEVLLAMVRGLPGLKEPAAFRAWLLKIICNRCRNYQTRGPKECQLPESPNGGTLLDTWAEESAACLPERALEESETARLVRQLVDQLPMDQRACILLFYYDELTVREIAAALSVPMATVKTRLHRARKTLRVGLRRHGVSALALTALLSSVLRAEPSARALPVLSASAKGAVAGAAVKCAAGIVAVGLIVGSFLSLRKLNQTEPPDLKNILADHTEQPEMLTDYLRDTVLQPAEWAVPDNGFTFDTPEDLSSEALFRLYLQWEDPETLESYWREDYGSYWLTDEIIRPVLDEHFRSYTFDLTQCMYYDLYSEAVRLAWLPEQTGTADMVLTDCQSSGSTVTVTAEFRGRYSWAQQPETVLYQRKVYEVALEPGGYYYLSAKEVPLDPAEVTTPQLGSGADAPVFTLADVTFEDVPFSSWPETTPEELDQRFGPVEDVETVVVHEFDGSCWETRVYDGISITCNREADGTGYTIGEITYERTDLPYVRDIRVGDSLETLLSTYRNEAWLYVPDEIEGYYCVSLYGTPIHMGTFALLEYRDGRPYDVMYQEGGAGVRFYLDDNCTISSIELFGGLFG